MIFVGEGKAEKAFLLHLKSIYSVDTLKVTIKSAGGKGPSNVISDAISTLQSTGYDTASALLDTDILWPIGKVKEAKQCGIELIGSTPCLEGFLLEIINQKKRHNCTSDECKKLLHKKLSGKETEKESYQKLFTKEVLDNARLRVENLDILIKLLLNEK